MDEIPNKLLTQGTASPTPKTIKPKIECSTPATSIQQTASQDTDWPDTIPVKIPSQIDQPEDQGMDRHQTQHNPERAKIPDLEENSEEEQFTDLDSYLAYHNTYEASQYIHQQYRSHLHALDDDQYYVEIDRLYYSYETLAAQDYRPANQASGPCRTTEELMQIFRKGRGQTGREELHRHRPFGLRTRSYKVASSTKLKRTRDYDKGTPIFINSLCHRIHHVNVKICQVGIKVYQPNVLLNKHLQNPGINPQKETNRLGTG